MIPEINELIGMFCKGTGAEIGGGGNRYMPKAIQIDKFIKDNPDSSTYADIQADACSIPLESNSLDFIFSAHCLEHIPNPIGALFEWKRILKDDGFMFLLLPHYQRMFDRHRKITPLSHCVDNYQNPVEPDYSHNDEMMEGWYGQERNEIEEKDFEKAYGFSPLNFEERVKHGVIHYHVWTQNEIVELMQFINMDIVFVSEYCSRPDSFIVIGRKERKE